MRLRQLALLVALVWATLPNAAWASTQVEDYEALRELWEFDIDPAELREQADADLAERLFDWEWLLLSAYFDEVTLPWLRAEYPAYAETLGTGDTAKRKIMVASGYDTSMEAIQNAFTFKLPPPTGWGRANAGGVASAEQPPRDVVVRDDRVGAIIERLSQLEGELGASRVSPTPPRAFAQEIERLQADVAVLQNTEETPAVDLGPIMSRLGELELKFDTLPTDFVGRRDVADIVWSELRAIDEMLLTPLAERFGVSYEAHRTWILAGFALALIFTLCVMLWLVRQPVRLLVWLVSRPFRSRSARQNVVSGRQERTVVSSTRRRQPPAPAAAQAAVLAPAPELATEPQPTKLLVVERPELVFIETPDLTDLREGEERVWRMRAGEQVFEVRFGYLDGDHVTTSIPRQLGVETKLSIKPVNARSKIEAAYDDGRLGVCAVQQLAA